MWFGIAICPPWKGLSSAIRIASNMHFSIWSAELAAIQNCARIVGMSGIRHASMSSTSWDSGLSKGGHWSDEVSEHCDALCRHSLVPALTKTQETWKSGVAKRRRQSGHESRRESTMPHLSSCNSCIAHQPNFAVVSKEWNSDRSSLTIKDLQENASQNPQTTSVTGLTAAPPRIYVACSWPVCVARQKEGLLLDWPRVMWSLTLFKLLWGLSSCCSPLLATQQRLSAVAPSVSMCISA